MTRFSRMQQAGSLAALAAALVVLACEGVGTPTRPAVSANVMAATESRAAADRPGAWVGDAHNAALADWRRTYKTLGKKQRDGLTICRNAAAVLTRHAEQIEARAGVIRSAAARRGDVYAAVTHFQKKCKGVGPAAMFGFAPVAMPTPTPMDDVSDNFEYYATAVASAVDGSDGSPASVANATNGILAEAAGVLSEADYNAVAAVATLSTSSSSYWTSTVGGSPDDFCLSEEELQEDCGEPIYETSLFAPKKKWLWPVLIIVGADAWSCVAGELSAIHAGNRDDKYLYTECAIWGGAGSLIAGMVFMK